MSKFLQEQLALAEMIKEKLFDQIEALEKQVRDQGHALHEAERTIANLKVKADLAASEAKKLNLNEYKIRCRQLNDCIEHLHAEKQAKAMEVYNILSALLPVPSYTIEQWSMGKIGAYEAAQAGMKRYQRQLRRVLSHFNEALGG